MPIWVGSLDRVYESWPLPVVARLSNQATEMVRGYGCSRRSRHAPTLHSHKRTTPDPRRTSTDSREGGETATTVRSQRWVPGRRMRCHSPTPGPGLVGWSPTLRTPGLQMLVGWSRTSRTRVTVGHAVTVVTAPSPGTPARLTGHCDPRDAISEWTVVRRWIWEPEEA